MPDDPRDMRSDSRIRYREDRSNLELRDANQHMRDFLDMLGHELRSPLAAMRNALRVLELKGEEAATRAWAHGLLERQARSIGYLVEDLLDISRIEHNKITLRKHPLDLTPLIRQAIENVQPGLDSCHHRLNVNVPQAPLFVTADPDRLLQILTNLLNNAVKYTEAGGHIQVTAASEGNQIVIRVQDNGLGIAPDMLPHIFDPFWQLDRAFEISQNGLGIGLALVRKLVALHDGSVNVASAGLGQGSEFVVTLPALNLVLDPSL